MACAGIDRVCGWTLAAAAHGCLASPGYRLAMAPEREVLTIGGREVTISNPRKVYFPETGHTKLDLVNYYLAVADGALRGAGGRPMALKRFVDGAAGQPFFQKRAPENTPDWIRTATLTFPSGRTADEIVIDDAAGLAWIVNLGCIDLNPHPVRAEDLDHPDELRVDLDPVPGIGWPQIRDVAMATKEALEAVGLVGWPKTSGSRGIHINVRIEPRWTYPEVRRAALALARDVERRVPDLATSKWWKEERHGVFLDYNQNAKDRTVASAYSIRPLPDARVSTPAGLGRGPDRGGRGIHDRHGARALREDRRPGCRHRRCGWVARRAAGAEPAPRGGGSGRCAVAAQLRQAGRRAAARPAVTPATRRRGVRSGPGRGRWPATGGRQARKAAVERGDPNAGLPTEWAGSRPTPTGRRKRSIPVVEIARAETKERGARRARALEGAAPGDRRLPRARGHPGRRHARPLSAVVPGPGEPDPRPGRRSGRPRSRSSPTTTRGRARTSKPGRLRRRGHAPDGRVRRPRRPDRRVERRPTRSEDDARSGPYRPPLKICEIS